MSFRDQGTLGTFFPIHLTVPTGQCKRHQPTRSPFLILADSMFVTQQFGLLGDRQDQPLTPPLLTKGRGVSNLDSVTPNIQTKSFPPQLLVYKPMHKQALKSSWVMTKASLIKLEPPHGVQNKSVMSQIVSIQPNWPCNRLRNQSYSPNRSPTNTWIICARVYSARLVGATTHTGLAGFTNLYMLVTSSRG